MSEIRTPETCEIFLHEAATDVNYASFKTMIASRILEGRNGIESSKGLITNTVIKAMRRYAEAMCEKQREICAEYSETKSDGYMNSVGEFVDYNIVDEDSILNAPSPIKE